jgi:UDP-2,3-diacylglucosamine hydrolase
MARALFVSDVHLRPDDPAKQERFCRFLRETADAALYILGDLFDYWIGARHYAREDFRRVLGALAGAAGRRPVAIVPGNRDFLLDARFTRRTGVRVLGPEAGIELDGRRVILAHGDFIFNRNSKYFLYRRLMRWRFLCDSLQMLPAPAALGLVGRARRVSAATTPFVRWDDADLVRASRRWLDGEARVLICGHIHSPRHLRFDGRELIVLGDWDAGGDFAAYEGNEFRLRRWT